MIKEVNTMLRENVLIHNTDSNWDQEEKRWQIKFHKDQLTELQSQMEKETAKILFREIVKSLKNKNYKDKCKKWSNHRPSNLYFLINNP